jgi:hypothetical protein
VRTAADIAMISADGGALEAFVEAKSAGKVRAIGVTGHHDPGILTEAVLQWPVDAVMLPVNPVEGILGQKKEPGGHRHEGFGCRSLSITWNPDHR